MLLTVESHAEVEACIGKAARLIAESSRTTLLGQAEPRTVWDTVGAVCVCRATCGPVTCVQFCW